MPYQDYHRLYLDQSIWFKDEKSLRPSVKEQILRQVRSRFPSAKHVWVVGELTTNYWDEDSDLDVLVAVPKEDIPKLSNHLAVINGREIITKYSPQPGNPDFESPVSKNHPVFWYLISDKVPVEIVSDKFGRVYDVQTQMWYGALKPNKAQFTDPKTLLRYINWHLFKWKETTELFPMLWTYVFAGFSELSDKDKLELIDNLKSRRMKLERMLTTRLKKYPKETWKAAEAFEEELIAEEDEDLAPAKLSEGSLPTEIVNLILHKFRYSDVIGRLEAKAEMEAENRFKEELMKGIPIDASTRLGFGEVGVAEQLLKRMDALFNFILSKTGGTSAAADTVTRLFMYVLDNCRYVKSQQVRKAVAFALYRHYVQGH